MDAKTRIPKCMATQHPDNVRRPPFAKTPLIEGQMEIDEALHTFRTGIREQMWDFEGKEADRYVVKKLLLADPSLFLSNILGQDLFLTFRVPNPKIEVLEAKLLIETLESIPRNYDLANEFYKKGLQREVYNGGSAPVFEVILPMATSHEELLRVKAYYEKFIAGKDHEIVFDIPAKDYVGATNPKSVSVIGLVEQPPEMMGIDKIFRPYIHAAKPDYLRVFLARSDPALNFGNVSAMLAVEMALMKLHLLELETGVPIYPILGAGGSPFRGNFRPETVGACMQSTPSVHTYTLQSSFRYDHYAEKVRAAIEKIKAHERSAPREYDEARSVRIIGNFTNRYQGCVEEIAPLVNAVAKYIPKRRRRALHTGLFGYSRGEGAVKLPRAIGFCAALYSVGIPPEIIGTDVLDRADWEYLKRDRNFAIGMRTALCHADFDIIRKELPALDMSGLSDLGEPDPEYSKLAKRIYKALKFDATHIDELVLEAAAYRNFMG